MQKSNEPNAEPAGEPQIKDERRPGRTKLAYDKEKRAIVEVAIDPRVGAAPIDVLLFCPNCAEQHVDEAKPDVCETCGKGESECACVTYTAWLNPPHKSHRCNFCNHVWRPADVPTNGVLKTETQGSRDGDPIPSTNQAMASRGLRARIATLEQQLAEANAALDYKVEIAPDDLLATMLARAERAEAEAAKLRAALEEYADPLNWIGYPLIRLWSKREAGYERAQAALEAPEAAREESE